MAMKAKYYFIIALGFVVVFASLLWMIHKNKVNEKAIHIAMVAPLSGTHTHVGISLKQGIELYLDSINKKGGVNGHKIVLDVYDDQNDPKRANMRALEIAKESQAVAVIGHYFSSASIEGGKVYKKYKIPAITPTSTNHEITQDNPWYFRTIFNDELQGRFLANYAKFILEQDTVSIIHENIAYGRNLAEVFERKAKALGMTVKYKWQFDTEDSEVEHSSNPEKNEGFFKIAKALHKNQKDAGLIFLATHEHEGIKFIKLIKDLKINNPIFLPDALSSQGFSEGFKKYRKEQEQRGFYTEGIYVTTPLIFDMITKKAYQFKSAYQKKHGVDPDWSSAFAYDTIHVLVEAMKAINIQGGQSIEKLVSDREKIKTYLASLNTPDQAIEGITGLNYFDESGESNKPVAIGIYTNNKIISAPTQFQAIHSASELSNLKMAEAKGRVLPIGKHFMYKTNVIYTGIEIKKISELNLADSIHDLEFYLWFRYRDPSETIKPQHIEFLNAVEPILLCNPEEKSAPSTIENEENIKIEDAIGELALKIKPKPVVDTNCIPIIEEKTVDGFIYRRYYIKAKFNIDFLPNHYFGQHLLGLNFLHLDLSRNYLIYVVDTLGMGLQRESALDRFEENQVFQSNDWKANEVLFFQDIMEKTSLGDPDYLNIEKGIEYSRYNVRIRIQEQNFTLHDIISEDNAHSLLNICIILLIALSLMSRNTSLAKIILFFQVVLVFILLSSLEILLLGWRANVDEYDLYTLSMIAKGFDILWWVMVAILLNIAVKRFLWMPLEEKTGRAVPGLAHRFVSFAIYLLAFFFIIAFVFDQKITSLLATSGMVAMIIGLAIQVNISNVFSGLAINIERPFRVGDWVKIGDFEEGKVLDVTWRATRIETSDNCVLNIPNSLAAESVIHNYCYPDNIVEASIEVNISSKYPPHRVEKILLDAILSVDDILKKPAPSTELKEIKGANAIYIVAYSISDYENIDSFSSNVWKHVWKYLNHAGITHAVQRQDIHVFKGGKEAQNKPPKSLVKLKELAFLRLLSNEAKYQLVQQIRAHRFNAGDIVKKGNENSALFIIAEGVVGLWVESEQGQCSEVLRLKVGDFFDETELYVGKDTPAFVKSITNSQLLEISKEDMTSLLENHPEVLKYIKTVLEKRRLLITEHIEQGK